MIEEVLGVQRMPRMADDPAAHPFDRRTRILFELPAKHVIGGDEVPGVEPEPDHRRGDSSRIRVCVIGPVKTGAGAILACEVATPAGNGDGNATALGGQLLAGQQFRWDDQIWRRDADEYV